MQVVKRLNTNFSRVVTRVNTHVLFLNQVSSQIPMTSVLRLILGKKESKHDAQNTQQPSAVKMLFDTQKFEFHSDLWFTIFKFMNPIELSKFSQTSKKAQNLVSSAKVTINGNWRVLLILGLDLAASIQKYIW